MGRFPVSVSQMVRSGEVVLYLLPPALPAQRRPILPLPEEKEEEEGVGEHLGVRHCFYDRWVTNTPANKAALSADHAAVTRTLY